MCVRLVQLSDLHLGRSFASLELPDELRVELDRASLDAVQRACEMAGEHDAAALLIPGDLFDRSEVDETLVGAVQTLLGDLGRPVLVSPGNHDAYGPISVWNNAALERMGLSPWPDNIHIFTTHRLSPLALLDGELVVHGHRVEGYHSQDDSPLSEVELVRNTRWNVLLIHGALSGGHFEDRTTLPFTPAQLAEIGADYVAAGHYHRFIRIEHEGRLLGAYAGVAVPGELDEDPHGGVLLVQLRDAGPEVECIQTHPGRIARLTVEPETSFESTDDAAERIRQTAAEADLDDDDIVFVRLTGLSRQQIESDALESELEPRFRHVAVSDDTRPEGIECAPRADGRVTIENQFMASLGRRIEQCDDAHRRTVLEAARRYGVLALRGRVVRPPRMIADNAEAEKPDAR